MGPESLSVFRFKRIHECLCALLVMAVIRCLLCRIRARSSLIKAGARAIEVGKRTIARQIGEKTLELVVGVQKGRRIVAVHRRPELLKCRVICHLVEGITRTVGQGHVPMLDLVSVFEFDRAPRNLPPLCCRPLHLRRYHQSRTPKALAQRVPESEPPRTKGACARRETNLQLCLRGLQSTLQTPPLMKHRP